LSLNMKILFCIQLFSIIFTICANNNATQNKVTNQKEIQDYLQNRNNYMLVEMDAKEVKNESILQEMMNDEIMEHAFTVGYGLMAGIFCKKQQLFFTNKQYSTIQYSTAE
ncbi:hypothetical protein T4A_4882, partial [Trichinella pseudospiralis]